MSDESETNTWRQIGQNILKQQLEKVYQNGMAKNVIFFMGDGMSFATIAAARIYSGQLHGRYGEETELSFEHFPSVGIAKVLIFHDAH